VTLVWSPNFVKIEFAIVINLLVGWFSSKMLTTTTTTTTTQILMCHMLANKMMNRRHAYRHPCLFTPFVWGFKFLTPYVRIDEVAVALKKMKRHKAPCLSGLEQK